MQRQQQLTQTQPWGWETVGRTAGRSREVLGRARERKRRQRRKAQGLLVLTTVFITLGDYCPADYEFLKAQYIFYP
jgi:hypothetical protein